MKVVLNGVDFSESITDISLGSEGGDFVFEQPDGVLVEAIYTAMDIPLSPVPLIIAGWAGKKYSGTVYVTAFTMGLPSKVAFQWYTRVARTGWRAHDEIGS